MEKRNKAAAGIDINYYFKSSPLDLGILSLTGLASVSCQCSWVFHDAVELPGNFLCQFFTPHFGWAEYQDRVASHYGLQAQWDDVIFITLTIKW